LVVGEVNVENILIGSESLSETGGTSVTDLVASEVEVGDCGVGVNELGQLVDGRVVKVVLVKIDLRESVVTARKSFSKSLDTCSADLVVVEVEGSDGGLASDGRGKSSSASIIDFILGEIDLGERSTLGNALSEVLGTRTGDLVLA